MSIETAVNRLGGALPAGGGKFHPLSEDEIISVEDQVGTSIPASYRSLLGKYGAFTFRGRSENNPYVYFSSKTNLPKYIAANGLAIFDFFYGTTQQSGPCGLHQQVAFFKSRIPETMIPIASDGGAGQICLGIKDGDVGKVFYWDMANEPLDDETYLEDFGEPISAETKWQNIYLIAESIEEFFDRLELDSNRE